jgi:hypothetical protein
MTYTSRTAEFAADRAELVEVYRAAGHDAADSRCSAIVAERGLSPSQALTLADAVRRHVILS